MATITKRISDGKIIIECTVQEAHEIRHALSFTAGEGCDLDSTNFDYYEFDNQLGKLLSPDSSSIR